MEDKKLTKRDLYAMARNIVENSNTEGKDVLLEFIDRQVEILDNKAAKSKERAAEKRAAGDELRGTIKSVLTNEYKTADEITALVDDEEVSKAKVIARLSQLVNLGEVEKTDVKTEDNRTVKAYRLAE